MSNKLLAFDSMSYVLGLNAGILQCPTETKVVEVQRENCIHTDYKLEVTPVSGNVIVMSCFVLATMILLIISWFKGRNHD